MFLPWNSSAKETCNALGFPSAAKDRNSKGYISFHWGCASTVMAAAMASKELIFYRDDYSRHFRQCSFVSIFVCTAVHYS